MVGSLAGLPPQANAGASAVPADPGHGMVFAHSGTEHLEVWMASNSPIRDLVVGKKNNPPVANDATATVP
jgi:hypothetical protein